MSELDTAKQARVLQLLRALGDRPSDVVASLAAEGITGVPDDPCHCPIANYLEQNGIEVNHVSSMEIHVAGELLLVSDEVPEPVAEFITEFDGFPWDFPDVIDPHWLEEHPA